MRSILIILTAGGLLLGPIAVRGGAQPVEPKLSFHSLAPITAKALDEHASEHVPPPVMTRLGARIDASGAIRYECRVADDPAYAAYRARIDAALRGEAVR